MMTAKKSQVIVYALPVILALISLGCGLSSRLGGSSANAQFAPTRTPMPTFTPTAVGAAYVEAPTVSAPPPEQPTVQVVQPESVIPSPTPEPTATPAPNNSVTITVLQDMNVRGGPGTNYPIVGPGPAGESAKVIGRNADSSWLQIEYPSPDGTGWVYAKLVQINGSPEAVAIAQAPAPPAAPPPTAAPPAQTEEQPAEAAAPAPSYQFTPTGWHASENAAICHFKGRIKDESGNLVNGYSVYVSNGSWGTISHPTGASVWYPGIGDGEWNVAGIQLNNCPGWWWITVVKYECDFNAGFDAQCKNFTRLSEDIKVEVVYPKETVINGDWTCHWDCDKGLYKDAYRRK